MTNALRSLRGTYWPALIALASILLVAGFLFAYPLVSAALGFAMPFVTMACMSAIFLAMNLRWSLWHGGRPVFFSIADTGFLLCLAAFALYGFAYVSDYGWNLPYVLIGLGIVGMFRVAFIEFEAWWLGILLCAIFALVFGPYMRLTLFEPRWFFDFGASLLLLTGLVLLLAGALASVLASPEASRREAWPEWLKAGATGLGVALVLALTASAVLTVSSRTTVAAPEAQGLPQARFEAGKLELSRGLSSAGRLQVLLVNDDLRVHRLWSKELGVDEVIGPMSELVIQVDLVPGFYQFECRIPGHSEWSTLEVR